VACASEARLAARLTRSPTGRWLRRSVVTNGGPTQAGPASPRSRHPRPTPTANPTEATHLEPTTNQTISVTPSAVTSLDAAAYDGTDATTYVQYVATVPAALTSVDVVLAGPADVTMTGSTVSFNKAVGFNYADFTSAAPLSDVASLGSAKIYAVNGVTIGAVTHVESIPVIAGKASIRVATSAANTAGSAVPVFFDPTVVLGVDKLVTNASGVPTGDFGIGGQVNINPGQAVAGNSVAVVTSVATTSFSSATATYFFNATDAYQIGGVAKSATAFMAALSSGDTVAVTAYLPTTVSGLHATTYNITADKPLAPTALAAALVDTNLDGTLDTARLTFTAAVGGLQAGAGKAEYRVAAVTGGVVGVFGAAVPAVTFTYASATSTTGTIDLAAIPAVGSYVYKVHILGLVGATFSDYSANSNTLVISAVPTPSVNGAPISNVAAFQDNNSNGTVDTGDVLRLTFNEPMSAPDAAASITLTDTNATPTIGTVTNGVNSTWTLSSDKLLMTITLTGGPVIGTAGTTPGVQYGCSVTASSGVTDLATNNAGGFPLDWNIGASADKTF